MTGNIKSIRQKQGISQRKLGELVGLDHRTIGRIEFNPCGAKLQDLLGISAALGVGLSDLLPSQITSPPTAA